MIDRYAVLGDPIEHSLSPVMHAAAFEAAGIEAIYEAHHVTPPMLQAHVACLRYGYRGFNVTVPHKEAIRRDLDEIDDLARRLGAVNTVVVREGRLIGHNTDVPGFARALDAAGFTAGEGQAVVLGAGGSARAVVAALTGRGLEVLIANRDEEKAVRLAARYPGATATSLGGPVLRDALRRAELVVNATSAGMGSLSETSPLPAGAVLRDGALAFDLVYGRETPFLRAARTMGLGTADGLEMLVQQGAESFRIWTGQQPNVVAMRKACEWELGRRQCSVS